MIRRAQWPGNGSTEFVEWDSAHDADALDKKTAALLRLGELVVGLSVAIGTKRPESDIAAASLAVYTATRVAYDALAEP